VADVVWRRSIDPPIGWFIRWLEKAKIAGGETVEKEGATHVEHVFVPAEFGDVEVERLFELWLDGYSEDSAAENMIAARPAPVEIRLGDHEVRAHIVDCHGMSWAGTDAFSSHAALMSWHAGQHNAATTHRHS
jgi:hypothetical protein